MNKFVIIIIGILDFLWSVCLIVQKKYISSILILIYGILALINNIMIKNMEYYLKKDRLESEMRYTKIALILGVFRCLIVTAVIIIFPLFGIK